MGESEPIEFTRDDADRLTRIETTQGDFSEKLDKILDLVVEHAKKHTELEIAVDRNTRFRRVCIKVGFWVLTSGGVAGLLTTGAKAMAWLGR